MIPAEVLDEVRDHVAREGLELSPAVVSDVLRRGGRPVGDSMVLQVHDQLLRDLAGAGPLEGLLREDDVTDVLVNGPDDVFVDRGGGLERVAVTFPDDDAVRRLAQRLATGAGRRLDDQTPYVDVRLAGGTRFHAVLAPVARPGTLLSLRVPRRAGFSLDELLTAGALTDEGASLLRQVISAKLAFLVSGGTGTGKTTLLNALLSLVPDRERIVVVEDSSELRPRHPHVVALEARHANVEGVGVVSMQTLVRQALRMRPDRLVVGEVRGSEVTDLLAAMNTGHEGGCGTLHANSAADVPARIEALALAAGLSMTAAQSQLFSAVELVAHLQRGRDGDRRLAELAVLSRGPSGLVGTESAVSFAEDGSATEGPGAPRLARLLERA